MCSGFEFNPEIQPHSSGLFRGMRGFMLLCHVNPEVSALLSGVTGTRAEQGGSQDGCFQDFLGGCLVGRLSPHPLAGFLRRASRVAGT